MAGAGGVLRLLDPADRLHQADHYFFFGRATAETQKTSADEEGLAPLMQWVKDLIDRILAEDFAAPDLEFTWAAEAAEDPLEQAQIDQIYVGAGIKTIDEVRAALGLAPVPGGAEPVVELPGVATLPGAGSPPAQSDAQKLEKWDFNAGQPRAPAGAPGSTGGQWIASDDGDDSDDEDDEDDDDDDSGDAQLIDVAAHTPVYTLPPATQQQINDFVSSHYAAALQAAQQLNLPVSYVLGLAALESGWGRASFAVEGNNFFNMGSSVTNTNGAIGAGDSDSSLASFKDDQDCFQAFVQDTQNVIDNARIKYKAEDLTSEEFAQALQDSGKYGIETKKGPDFGKPVSYFIPKLELTIRAMPGHIKDVGK